MFPEIKCKTAKGIYNKRDSRTNSAMYNKRLISYIQKKIKKLFTRDEIDKIDKKDKQLMDI